MNEELKLILDIKFEKLAADVWDKADLTSKQLATIMDCFHSFVVELLEEIK